jgi:NADP-dependent 3-hydroxy acid dehydrogenase YdfG
MSSKQVPHVYSALVTGSSSGIGLGLSRFLMEDNALVYGISRRGTDIVDGQFCDMICDVRNESQVEEILAEIQNAEVPLETVVLNAGVLAMDPLSETSHKEFLEMLETNVMGVFHFLKHLHGVIAEDVGHIFVVGSQAASQKFSHLSAYSASKAALRPIVEEAREEFRQLGVRVTMLSPGAIDTPLWSNMGIMPEDQNMMSINDFVDVFKMVHLSPPHLQFNEINFQHYLGTKVNL